MQSPKGGIWNICLISGKCYNCYYDYWYQVRRIFALWMSSDSLKKKNQGQHMGNLMNSNYWFYTLENIHELTQSKIDD